MDFFAQQDSARRHSRRLVGLFAVAVVAIVVAVYLAATVLLFGVGGGETAGTALWDPARLLSVAAVVLLVVGAGSLYKIARLARGGAAIAELLGGRRLAAATTEAGERRLLNVVEEMALASGVPVPAVYLLDAEPGINAFAAGFSPADAVVGVTRGAVERLRREELQGVIAHEFSHLLNGDMRLNLRLVGLLHGILVIALIGEVLLRNFRGSSGRGRKGGASAVLLFGFALYAIGWIGVLCGRLIKAGVSRQREYLADAAAVQFTRDPSGIGGALKKIGGLVQGSRLRAPHAEEASHFYFADGLGTSAPDALATHPPLGDRIRRIDPSFDGVYPVLPPLADDRPGAADAPTAAAPEARGALERALLLASGAAAVARLSARAGRVREQHLAGVRTLLAAVPVGVRQMLREPLGAQAVVCALLLDSDPEVRERQLARLGELAEADFRAWVRRLDETLPRERSALRIPLVDLAVPALRELGPARYAAFSALVRALVDADPRTSLFELALERALQRHLAPHFGGRAATRADTFSLRSLVGESSALVSAIVHAVRRQPAGVEAAFAAGAALLAERGIRLRLVAPEECTPERLGAALDRLDRVALPWKRALLDALDATAAVDGRLEPEEAELLRAVADALGIPVPPPQLAA